MLENFGEGSASLDDVDVVILEGAATVHFLQQGQARGYDDYAVKIFLPYILGQEAQQVDIIWDQYRYGSIKAGVREQQGKGVRRHRRRKVQLLETGMNVFAIQSTRLSSLLSLLKYSLELQQPNK